MKPQISPTHPNDLYYGINSTRIIKQMRTPQKPLECKSISDGDLDYGISSVKITIVWNDNSINFPTAGLAPILCESIDRFEDYCGDDIIEVVEGDRYRKPVEMIDLDNEDVIAVIKWFKRNEPAIIKNTAPISQAA